MEERTAGVWMRLREFALEENVEQEGCEGCESCTKNMKWTPIMDCREELQLALTPVVEDGNLIKLETQKFDPKNNLQLWKQNIHGVLINKGLKKAIYADVFDFYMDTSKK